MKKHILITGSSGYLGQHLLHSFLTDTDTDTNKDYILTAAYGSLPTFKNDTSTSKLNKVQLDLTDPSSIESLFKTMDEQQPVDILIHLAAMSSPAQCANDVETCYAINCPSLLLQALPETCSIIFLSTDQVYDGNPQNAPFSEEDTANPVNEYGKSKLKFESMLLQQHKNVIILRSSLMLGRKTLGECRKQSFLQFVESRLVNGQVTDYFSDEVRCVVHVQDVVTVIRYFVDNSNQEGVSGVYNLGGRDRVSRIDLALAIARYLNMDESLCHSVKRFSDEFEGGGGVASPPDISVRMDKLKRVTGIETMGLDDIVRNSFG